MKPMPDRKTSGSVTLSEIKTDLPALLNVLGVDRVSNHLRCRFCTDQTALSVHEGVSGWRFKCHRCSKAGDVADAVALAEGIPIAEALKRLGVDRDSSTAPRRKPAPRPIPEPVAPIPDRDRLHRLVEVALAGLDGPEAAPWLKKRGVTPEVCRRYVVGFVPSAFFSKWPTWDLGPCWAICVHDAEGNTRAVKLHRENPPADQPKCLWAPFGTDPADKPRNGYAELWPPPEAFATADTLFLCPGELKAVAVLATGRAATSPTSGESFKWTPGLVARLAGRRVVIVYDDDPPAADGKKPAGQVFRDATVKALSPAAHSVKTLTFGKAT